jgi:hypothetical protein
MNKYIRYLFVGIYAWLSALFFGGVILDGIYARNLENILDTADQASLFSEISDILLIIAFILVITALIAIALSWKSNSARNLLIASLLVLSLEFWLPIFFSMLNINQDLSWLRLLIDGSGSLLALLGLYRFFQADNSLGLA